MFTLEEVEVDGGTVWVTLTDDNGMYYQIDIAVNEIAINAIGEDPEAYALNLKH